MLPKERYLFSVVEVSQRLHGDICGSGDPIPDDHWKQLREWLRWRLSEGWEFSAKGNPPYDESVRQLGLASLREARSKPALDNQLPTKYTTVVVGSRAKEGSHGA